MVVGFRSHSVAKLKANRCHNKPLTSFYSYSGFVIPPQSVNISLNEVAEINCIAIATFINWVTNGQPLENAIRDKGFDDSSPTVTLNETKELRMRILRVVGSPDSNGANISCIAFLHITATNVSTAVSEPALILVQGDVE